MKKLTTFAIALMLSIALMAKPMTHKEVIKIEKNYKITSIVLISTAAVIGISTGFIVPSAILLGSAITNAVRVKIKLKDN